VAIRVGPFYIIRYKHGYKKISSFNNALWVSSASGHFPCITARGHCDQLATKNRHEIYPLWSEILMFAKGYVPFFAKGNIPIF
jgi:hypothetical protein